jgi:hypothetical protein
MTVRIVTDSNGRKYITNEPLREVDYKAAYYSLLEKYDKLAAECDAKDALLERQTARIVELQEHIENFDGEDR